MKRRDAEKHFLKHGCSFFREGSMHTIFINSNGFKFSIPRHREVKNVLIMKICKDLKIPRPSKF